MGLGVLLKEEGSCDGASICVSKVEECVEERQKLVPQQKSVSYSIHCRLIPDCRVLILRYGNRRRGGERTREGGRGGGRGEEVQRGEGRRRG